MKNNKNNPVKRWEKHEWVSWDSLPGEVKADTAMLESVMETIDKSENVSQKCREFARRFAGQRGMSRHRLRAKYYEWRDSGRNWRVLVDWARVGQMQKTPRSLCDTLYKTYCGKNQRANKRAYSKMMHDIRCGITIDGIGLNGGAGDWTDIWRASYPDIPAPDVCPMDWTPPGMSYRNMQTYANITEREQIIMRIGTRAAHFTVPPVYSTRVGMKPGQLYQCDDVWHDIEVIMPGVNKGLARPLEFACIDYASTNKIAYALVCQIENDDGSKTGLNERQMLYLICHILTNVGYHRDGCVIVIEHGTATVRPKIRDIITRLTGGKVVFRTSEIIGKAIVGGMYDGTGKGNFKAKALVENSHRLLHYEAAYLPAQTGANSRIDRPEQLAGLEKYAKDIVKKWETLPESKRGLLWAHALTFWAYRSIVKDLYTVIYNRTDHRCEGWEENEWEVPVFSIDGKTNWTSEAIIPTLSPKMQELAKEVCKTDGHVKARRKSPVEVWVEGQDELEHLPPWSIIEILGDKYCHKASVGANGLIEFQDRNIMPGRKLRFQSQVKSPAGEAFILPPNKVVNVYAFPHDLSKAVYAEPDTLEIIGVAPAWNAVSPINSVQVDAAIEAQQKLIAAADAPLKARHEDDGHVLDSWKASNDKMMEDAEIVVDPAPVSRQMVEDNGGVDLNNYFNADFDNNDEMEGDPNDY